MGSGSPVERFLRRRFLDVYKVDLRNGILDHNFWSVFLPGFPDQRPWSPVRCLMTGITVWRVD